MDVMHEHDITHSLFDKEKVVSITYSQLKDRVREILYLVRIIHVVFMLVEVLNMDEDFQDCMVSMGIPIVLLVVVII